VYGWAADVDAGDQSRDTNFGALHGMAQASLSGSLQLVRFK
jgi:hypothetical protein